MAEVHIELIKENTYCISSKLLYGTPVMLAKDSRSSCISPTESLKNKLTSIFSSVFEISILPATTLSYLSLSVKQSLICFLQIVLNLVQPEFCRMKRFLRQFVFYLVYIKWKTFFKLSPKACLTIPAKKLWVTRLIWKRIIKILFWTCVTLIYLSAYKCLKYVYKH